PGPRRARGGGASTKRRRRGSRAAECVGRSCPCASLTKPGATCQARGARFAQLRDNRCMKAALRPAVDGALRLDHPGATDAEANRAAVAVARALARGAPAGFLDAIPGARTLLVLFDPEVLTHAAVEELLLRIEPLRQEAEPRAVRLPALYGGKAGPDLDALARRAGLAAD